MGLLCAVRAGAETIQMGGVSFECRLPRHTALPCRPDGDGTTPPRVMVLFGGRGWQGKKTLETYAFGRLADRHRLILLSPSFCEGAYWEPESGSGDILKRAVVQVCRLAGVPDDGARAELYLYGYSAGGQCANLFYAWMPGDVAAWGAHACGVYGNAAKMKPETGKRLAPALITCGTEDTGRHVVSRQFAYTYREMGGALLWKPFAGIGHALNRDALALAETWFDALLSGGSVRFVGEDDTRRVFPAVEAEKIDVEFRNPVADETVRERWGAE